MGWTTHVDALRLDRQTWYYIWRIDDDLSISHPLLRAPCGALLHASEPEALEVARTLAEPITSKSLHTTDFDAALAWAGAPQASNLDASLLMNSWHLLVDLDVLPSPVEQEDSYPPSVLAEIFDKLHWPEQTPAEWTLAEAQLLAATLREGIGRLQARLVSNPSHGCKPPAG
jgi:hypothetical protein